MHFSQSVWKFVRKTVGKCRTWSISSITVGPLTTSSIWQGIKNVNGRCYCENFYCDLYEQQRIVQKVLLMAVPISWGDCHGELVIQWGKWQSFSKGVFRNFQFMTFSSGGVLLRIKCFSFYLLYNLINNIWINPITINYSTCVRGLDREWKSIIEYLGLCGPIYCFPFMYVKWLWSLPGKVNRSIHSVHLLEKIKQKQKMNNIYVDTQKLSEHVTND